MTYERSHILKVTIENLQSQTFPPEYILIIDNSETHKTEKLIKDLEDPYVGYFRVGYNSGPAGAAKNGLKNLESQGYSWIYWGDDDNPPKNNTYFEHLFSKIEQHSNELEHPIGVIGGRGGNLNSFTGRIRSLNNKQLKQTSLVEVDYVPGGHTMIVNSQVVKKEVLPDERLFFGFEELDFCLRVQKKGFSVVTDTEEWIKDHVEAGNLSPEYRWRGSSFGNPETLWRSYYSTRNLLLLYRDNKFHMAFTFLFFKTVLKSIAGFRHGLSYGKQNFRIQWKAIIDFLLGHFGKRKSLDSILQSNGQIS